MRCDLGADSRGPLDLGVVLADILNRAASSSFNAWAGCIDRSSRGARKPFCFRTSISRRLFAHFRGTVCSTAEQAPEAGGGLADPLTRVNGAIFVWLEVEFIVRKANSVREVRYPLVSVRRRP